MTDTPNAKYSMDDFLINPASINMDENYVYDAWSRQPHRPMPVIAPDEPHAMKHGQKTSEPSATIRNFTDERIWWGGYTSDEEIASPVDDDDFSILSTDSDPESASSFKGGLYHAETCNNSQQLCSRAQAVQVVSAGKAKVVTMPKAVEVSSPRLKRRPLIPAAARTPVSWINPLTITDIHQSSDSRLLFSPRLSNEKIPGPQLSAPSMGMPTAHRSVRRKMDFSRSQIQPRSVSSQSISSTPTLLPAQKVRFVDDDAFHSHRIALSPTPSTLSLRRMHKLSPSFSLRGFGIRRRRRSGSDYNTCEEAVRAQQLEPLKTSAPISDMHVPTRTSSKPMPRMVPRGANERAPPIVPPPCPDDLEDDNFAPFWPPRKDAARALGGGRPSFRSSDSSPTATQTRRTSVSTLASTQL
ncbi:hypothetical protein LTR37_017132 [Vermiconidia calcicola]|uniref:Uncharacterized protein n=1 Tax=Vermiconidia calcicola TaxID=1690605 RepID=A0ACC3ML06_9PEZI|nr:hypothetical protein LTR37_017132 [Vermiconidia calcicola]